ncbi:uncharacterized protein L969DRAFT_24452 [Mixia osmundae IAM 14324]|uniref:ATP-dependent DNA helicase II subunit 2 n=1 Tax=Mixia osmundae (strain CBS 9802 / IAM 14324 / JCM 22182 / KY 12970) TaxID=764103 RepID=G7E0Y3_MIXOS|nr:uncharacterized protein L969DRAFT_24452 [Mixia osmundae IAM 14324]KEI38873.1 hypothetical protein L969DRAFT_24452 [Mixia osmundae IAM 14324]GAA96493.1 hypothetical protein E5Q_03161 [Mixia osmundae IAM 14324]
MEREPERAGRNVTLFLVDCSSSMANKHDFPEGRISSRDYAIRFLAARFTSKILKGLKTEHLGVTLFGSDKTSNVLADENVEGYENIRTNFIPISQPTLESSERLQRIRTSDMCGDILSALACALYQLQSELGKSRVAYRKTLVLVTDAESKTMWDPEDVEKLLVELGTAEVELSIVIVGYDPQQARREHVSSDKATNERELRKMVSKLRKAGQPAVITSASAALSTAEAPQLKLPNSAPMYTTITLGHAELFPDSTITIKAVFKKAVTKANPMTKKKMSKIVPSGPSQQPKTSPRASGSHAKRDADGMLLDEEEPRPSRSQYIANRTYEVQPERIYYRVADTKEFVPLPELLNRDLQDERSTKRKFDEGADSADEDEMDRSRAMDADEYYGGNGADRASRFNAEREVRPEDLVKAYKYGATLVPLADFDEIKTDLNFQPGLQVISFTKASIALETLLGDVYYVHAHQDSPPSQVMFSAFIHAMHERQAVALTRYVGKRGAAGKAPDAKLGYLIPRIGKHWNEDYQYCIWVQLPFSEDIRMYEMDSIEYYHKKDGSINHEHRNLPGKELMENMDAWVDAMDMSTATVDADGNYAPWFDVHDSYNPAIHHLKNSIVYRANNPEDTSLPEIHPEISKYLQPTQFLQDRAKPSAEAVKATAGVKRLPPKAQKGSKAARAKKQLAPQQEELQFDKILGKAQSQSETPANRPSVSSLLNDTSNGRKYDSDVLTTPSTYRPAEAKAPNADLDGDTEDEDEPAGSHQGTPALRPATAIDDFNSLVKTNDVKEAIEGMFALVHTIVKASFGGNRYEQARKYITLARVTASEEDEVSTYNDSIRDLKTRILTQGFGNQDFWQQIRSHKLGLITIEEDKNLLGGQPSDGVSDSEAAEFLS